MEKKKEAVVYLLFEPGETIRLVHGCRKEEEEKQKALAVVTTQLT